MNPADSLSFRATAGEVIGVPVFNEASVKECPVQGTVWNAGTVFRAFPAPSDEFCEQYSPGMGESTIILSRVARYEDDGYLSIDRGLTSSSSSSARDRPSSQQSILTASRPASSLRILPHSTRDEHARPASVSL
eukprot:gnl/TRDRNA2_/TRDRNA2_173597_c0_seq1.p1 gnl/TRDRNA2_/TRDRNA2_173597_c0~~gnl/TRDRNA2_/TRDRNA2_173597_c0_seq1.p1  ORF type:complete len:134 (+),score=9.20 gnl/TRDRNA2_/TRDRNA2_173597_c0_seq1:48-449(+)